MTEKERVDRFEAAYNRIDRALGEIVEGRGQPRRHPFSARVRIAANRRRRLSKHADFLLEIGDLRNAIIHNRLGQDEYIAVPGEQTVLELENIEKRMLRPQPVTPKYERALTTLRTNETLARVLELVRRDGYSRYPVYENGGFAGLLTSNGVARWIAAHTQGAKLEVNASSVHVSDVLQTDHRRGLVSFLPRSAAIDDAEQLFADKPGLEAILITENGRAEEKPIGMICASDIAALAE